MEGDTEGEGEGEERVAKRERPILADMLCAHIMWVERLIPGTCWGRSGDVRKLWRSEVRALMVWRKGISLASSSSLSRVLEAGREREALVLEAEE